MTPHEHQLLPRDLQPKFAQTTQIPSHVRGMLAKMANDLPDTPDNTCYRRILTQAANHLLSPSHPDSDMRHTISTVAMMRGLASMGHVRRNICILYVT